MPQSAQYHAALHLIAYIDARLAYGRAFRDRDGQRLDHLGQVLHAILNDTIDLPFIKLPAPNGKHAGGAGTPPSPNGRGARGEGR